MNTRRALVAFVFLAGATIAAAQSSGGDGQLLVSRPSLEARLVNAARLAYLQKSEPDAQNPATPQASTGESKSEAPSQPTSPNAPNTSPSTLTPTVDDPAALQSRIQGALRNDPALNTSHVAATVTDRTIDLSGTVNSSQDKQTAERIAASFDGNRQLNDKLVVTGAGAAPSAAAPPQR
jgi:hypothetical protein